MNEQTNTIATCHIDLFELEYLKIEALNSNYTVTLTDYKGTSILKGYGNSIVEALNDLHHNLI